jgi:hypothetical protein
MIQKRAIRVVATGARLLAGVVIAVGCVVGVVAAVALPWPQVTAAPAQMDVTPAAGDTTLVCAGDFRAVGRNSQDAAQQFSAGTPKLTVDSTGEREQSALEAPGLSESAGPQRFVGSAARGGESLIAAAESITLAAEDLSGLAASPCREARTESWLVGGAVETGTSDLIILSNPGDVTANVTLTVFGVEATSSSVLVPAHTQQSVPLASIAVGAQSPVVRVTAEGAPVRAMLQSSLIRTLDPSGVDVQDTAGVPSARIGFAGVQVLSSSPDTALTVLRLLATEQATEVRVSVRAEGEVVQKVTAPLELETPTEINFEGLEPGVYSIDVEADAAVVGAVRQTTRPGAKSDFAWMTSAPDIDGEVFVAVPAGPDPRLHLVNPADAEATVTLAPASDPDAEGEEIRIPAGEDVTVDVDPDTVYAVETDAPVRVAVMLSGTDALAGWPVWPGAAAREPITVYP